MEDEKSLNLKKRHEEAVRQLLAYYKINDSENYSYHEKTIVEIFGDFTSN